MIHLLLADDHGLVRAGLKVLLQRLSDVHVVGDVGDGLDALKFVVSSAPDIVLMDITMPGLNGLEATARIKKVSPRTNVILLSMTGSEEYLCQAMEVGASGYLLKGSDLQELDRAIRTVFAGQVYITPAVAKHLAPLLQRAKGEESSALSRLTPRQREVLQLIAEGHSTKSMADRLGLSAKTVESHRVQLMDRLKIYDVASLVRFAIRAGVINSATL